MWSMIKCICASPARVYSLQDETPQDAINVEKSLQVYLVQHNETFCCTVSETAYDKVKLYRRR